MVSLAFIIITFTTFIITVMVITKNSVIAWASKQNYRVVQYCKNYWTLLISYIYFINI